MSTLKRTKYLQSGDVFRYKGKWVICERVCVYKYYVEVKLRGVDKTLQLTKGYETISEQMTADAKINKAEIMQNKFINFFK